MAGDQFLIASHRRWLFRTIPARQCQKKALGRTSEPRHWPSTVAPISRRSPRLCCTHKFYKHSDPGWESCLDQKVYGELLLEFAFICLRKKNNSQARSGGAVGELFFQRKICNNRTCLKVIRIRLASVVAKQSSERTSRRTNVGIKQQEPFLRTRRKCQASSVRFSEDSFFVFCFELICRAIETRFENSYGRHGELFGILGRLFRAFSKA